MTNGRYNFNGFTNTRLYWHEVWSQWRLELLSDPNVFATVNSTEYPYGTFNWEFFGDRCNGASPGGENKSEIVTINFNACSTDEFNCVDGG